MGTMKSKLSLKERLKKRKKELQEKGGGNGILFIKPGTIRVRILPTGHEKDFILEATHFYLNEKLKGFFSPATFGEPCPAVEEYQNLKSSKDEDDQELAKKLVPKTAYLMPVLVYSDDKGKKVNEQDSGKLMKIPSGLYQQIIDLYLDEDEWGDMTNPKKGYDIKITRTGTGKNDTEYTVAPCKNTPLPKNWAKKEMDLEKMVRGIIEPVDSIQSKVDEFIGNDLDDDDDDYGKSKKKSGKKKSKEKPSSKKGKKKVNELGNKKKFKK